MYLKAIKKSNRKKSMWLFLLQYFFPPLLGSAGMQLSFRAP